MKPLFRKQQAFPSVTEGSTNPETTGMNHVTQPAAFEGRTLDRPHEDIEDQGLAFDLGTIIDRRKVLGAAGIGVGAMILAACTPSRTSSSATSSTTTTPAATTSQTPSATATPSATYTTEMPDEVAGPYPGDGSNGPDVLEATGVERSNITTSIGSDVAVAGVPMMVTMQVIDMANNNQPMANAAVYIWQCDAQGNYSMYSSGVTNETFLRGVQVTDAQGMVTFETIVPGCYPGRWPHIHFEVFSSIDDITDSTKAILTSQMAISEAVSSAVYADSAYTGSAANLSQLSIETDGIFADGWEMQLLDLQGSPTTGYTSAALPIPIDTNTAPTAGVMVGGGRGGFRTP